MEDFLNGQNSPNAQHHAETVLNSVNDHATTHSLRMVVPVVKLSASWANHDHAKSKNAQVSNVYICSIVARPNVPGLGGRIGSGGVTKAKQVT